MFQYLLLGIKDNGIAMNDLNRDRQGESFGYDLIQSYVENMEGEWNILSENGTEANILLKDYEKAA